ncbi:hypothetical protein [Streptomyces sp. NPDC008139]|uniref:hypothetical protein n=1 Tax=Streptomyces sp. NPDC008139 TaxID=3364814 RepID=UPI0036EEB3C9
MKQVVPWESWCRSGMRARGGAAEPPLLTGDLPGNDVTVGVQGDGGECQAPEFGAWHSVRSGRV